MIIMSLDVQHDYKVTDDSALLDDCLPRWIDRLIMTALVELGHDKIPPNDDSKDDQKDD